MPPAKSETSPAQLARALETFLAEHPHAAVLEDGHVLFDMRSASYSLSVEHGRCALHLWSEERNLVRSIVDMELRKDALRLSARRFGQARPQWLELVADRDRRTPATRNVARSRYLRMLDRVLTRYFADLTLDNLKAAADLEHSFGPAYARGVLVRGTTAWAVLGVSSGEPAATIDGALTLGILWLDYCRRHSAGRRLFEGLKIILPAGSAATTATRMAWLHPSAAKWELYELDESTEELLRVESISRGNLEVQLVHAFDPASALERFRVSIDRVFALLPEAMRTRVELRPRGPAEVAMLLHGLEFARIRHGTAAGSFERADQVTFGAGPSATVLDEETEALFRELIDRVAQSRHAEGSARDPLYRLQPERWLESELRRDLAAIEPQIRSEYIYTQVPAVSGGDRGMLDLLSVTRSGRLLVLELKADDDLHLPLQGLDYWIRVRQLACEGHNEFARAGYFRGVELARRPPLLDFVVPALRLHPSNETVLRYFAPEVEWSIIALGEDWRRRRNVVFRKHAKGSETPVS